jgi:hypothetical protein
LFGNRSSAAIKPARNVPYFMAYYRKGRVGTIHSSEFNFDPHRIAALGRAKAPEPKRRRALICLLASAIIPLIGTDAFSNAAHKQVASIDCHPVFVILYFGCGVAMCFTPAQGSQRRESQALVAE